MRVTGFVGIDPVGLLGLAETSDQFAARIALMRSALSRLLDRHVPYTGSGAAAVLATASTALTEMIGELRWRANTIESAQSAGVSGTAPLTSNRWLAEFAACAVFSLETWAETFEGWRNETWLVETRRLAPSAVASAFAAIDLETARTMARTHPDLVGDLDGVPAEVRYLANRILIERELDRLERIVAKIRLQGYRNGFGVVAGKVEARIEEYRRWLDEPRQILLFDPRGDGRIAEVFGDLTVADRVAVVVPGMANDVDNFSTGPGSLRMDAAHLYQATSLTGVATIAWLGYDTPDGVDATVRAAAERGAPNLARFLHGVDPFAARDITVVAHSYGSVVAGLAATEGIEADNLVFVGSPGTTLDHANDAVLRQGGQVWAALAGDDPIGFGIDPTPSYRWWHGFNPVLPIAALAASMVSRDDLWHGANPVSDEFGAQRITTEGSSGHCGYFEAETLENLVMILEGRYSEVGLIS